MSSMIDEARSVEAVFRLDLRHRSLCRKVQEGAGTRLKVGLFEYHEAH